MTEQQGRELYGYNDPALVSSKPEKKKWIKLAVAIIFILLFWLALDYKLLFGKDWISETYDTVDWRTNEGNLHTYGAWDFETHVWKTEYIMQNFPHFNWNPYWYLGMPLLKYYQLGFYGIHALFIVITGLSAARSALLLIILGHLLATLMTFVLCYRFSRRIWVSALSSVFLLTSTFISLRSYGWEPITVVFLFLFPLGLLLFFKEPLQPFRFWLILVLGLAYLGHPLIWFALCMSMGLYLLTVALRKDPAVKNTRYLWKFVLIVLLSILIGAVQFIPQMSYTQVTSGAHMGVKYLPFYQVPFNIISVKDFFFDAGNLKGPGPIILIATVLLIAFAIFHRTKQTREGRAPSGGQMPVHEFPRVTLQNTQGVQNRKTVYSHSLVRGLVIILLFMILFYYAERYDIFPMNILSSIQYHRIIPEFVIIGAVLVACLFNVIQTRTQKILYTSTLIAFVIASSIIVYNVQTKWQTTQDISTKPEFINDTVLGRISFPYTDQSLSVRNSFTFIPQVYGYYEQGITNSYTDEMFSVSSGYHDATRTLLYLKAANVGRLYVNLEEGERDKIVMGRMNHTLTFVNNASRYGYFIIPLKDPSLSQAVDGSEASNVQKLALGCRVLFKVKYCGSAREEFVSNDPAEIAYLQAYVDLLEKPYAPKATIIMDNPDHYTLTITNATKDTVVVVKMTFDKDFKAKIMSGNNNQGTELGNNGKRLAIEPIGPSFMLIKPETQGDYTITLTYGLSKVIIIGFFVSLLTIISLALFFIFRPKITMWREFPGGDLS
jgi:hypothetical protein